MKNNKQKDGFLKQAFVTQTKGFVDVSIKRNFWSEFAEKTNGSFKISQTISKDLAKFSLKIPIDNGNIEFTESDTHPFKVYCEINSGRQIEFSIAHEDFVDAFLKVFGFKDINLSHPEFDKKYLVKGSDEKIVRHILNSETVIPLILKTNIFSILSEYDKEKSKLKISGLVGRSVNSMDEMQDVYFLFQAIIDQIKKL
jgi:hypothetical protein